MTTTNSEDSSSYFMSFYFKQRMYFDKNYSYA